MTAPHGPLALDVDEARSRLPGLTVLDVRTPGEYATGHLPDALNIPLDRLKSALPTLRRIPGGQLLVVCASGARSENACRVLAEHGVRAMTLTGGTQGWARRGHELHRPTVASRATWSMERQVRFTAGAIVLTGLGLGLLHPAWQLLSAGVAGGLVFSALSNTCGMAALLSKLPHNRPRPADLEATLATLAQRGEVPVT
ncbi:rhodanese-like domain-containing protein [Streptomyces sp. DT2A-34]|uniref:rhodanese-like domain-containing protein n=1 Tax=Streptomyces sp. DT2A-34 TaxID=3051182 RepID=UPI00265C431D|nr:rhodanese-like domain-containing protein [Streptomyces sp. DT2A-34]MDO0909535.1 rhodanese-like domain-containing protein [Streptomyces sp. DT2A-34]